MKTNYCHIAVILFCLPVMIYGQQSNGQKLGFYTELAFKDAQYENTFALHSLEDELDYWKDQLQFEKSLKEKDVWAYQIYLNNKRKAYSRFQKECLNNCERSEQYLRMASFYAINGAEQPTKKVVSFSSSQRNIDKKN